MKPGAIWLKSEFQSITTFGDSKHKPHSGQIPQSAQPLKSYPHFGQSKFLDSAAIRSNRVTRRRATTITTHSKRAAEIAIARAILQLRVLFLLRPDAKTSGISIANMDTNQNTKRTTFVHAITNLCNRKCVHTTDGYTDGGRIRNRSRGLRGQVTRISCMTVLAHTRLVMVRDTNLRMFHQKWD